MTKSKPTTALAKVPAKSNALARVASKAKATTKKLTPGPTVAKGKEVILRRADGKKLGSGRRSEYRGTLEMQARKGSRLAVKRTDSHKARVFKTQPVVKSELKEGKPTYTTKSGSVYTVDPQ